MMKKTLLLILPMILLAFNGPAEVHDYHVATVYLENTESELQIMLSIFTDDLERRFKQIDETSLFLGDPDLEVDDADARIESYLRSCLALRHAGNEMEWRYLGKEVEYEICWIYMESEPISGEGFVEADLRVLFDLYPDQSNVINWKDGEQKQRKVQRSKDGPVKFE